MAQQSFGTRLAEARRRRGLSIEQVHSQLRISSSILESLEAADFYHMPLKGHARNMVSAYARYLGLDSADVIEQFKREYHDFENRESRWNSSSVELPGASSGRYDSSASSISYSRNPETGQGVRSMWNTPIPPSNINRDRESRSSPTRRSPTPVPRRGVSATEGSLPKNEYGGSATRRTLPAQIFSSVFRSPIVVVVTLVVVLALLLVLWATVANSCKKQDDLIPVTGGETIRPTSPAANATATDPGDDVDAAAAAADDSKYGPFELVVEPAAGTAPWTEVTVDGEKLVAQIFEEKDTWTVEESCKILTAQPSNIGVYRNGEQVTLTIDDTTGAGSVELTVLKKPEPDPEPGQEASTNG